MSTVSEIEPVAPEPRAAEQPGAVRSGALLFAAMVAGTGATYLFYLASGRLLGPGDYGEFAALVSLVTLVSLPFNAIQMALSREVSGLLARGESGQATALTRAVIRAGALATVVLVVVFLALMVPLADALQLRSVGQLGFAAVALAPAILYPIFLGDLQGHQQFRRLSIGTAFPLVFRLVLFAVLAIVGWKLYGALAALAVGSVAGLVLPLSWRRELLHRLAATRLPVRPFLVALVPVMVGILAVTALTNVDVLIVKARMPSEDAGIYGAASAFAKVAFFMPLAIVGVLFPRVAARRALGRETKDILGRALIVTVVFCVALFLVYIGIGHFLVHVSYGPEFQDASSLLGLFGLGMTCFSVVNVLVSYHLSRHESRFAWIVGVGAVCQAVALAIVPADLRTFLWVNAGVGATLLVAHELAMGSSVPALRAGFAHAWEELALPARARSWPRRAWAWIVSLRLALAEAAIVLTAFTGLAVLLTWPLVAHLGDRFIGGGGDVFGAIGDFWRQAQSGGYHLTGSTYITETGAPFGWHKGNGVNIQSSLAYYPAYLLTKAFGGIAAYDLVVLAGLVLSAGAMYWLVRRLSGSVLVAGWAGLVFMVFPWHIEKAEAHGSLAHIEGFPLLALALLAWFRKPGPGSLLAIGATTALLWLTSGYFGVIALVALAVLLPIAAWFQRRRLGPGSALGWMAAAGATAFLAGGLIYGIASLGKANGEISPGRDISNLAWFGARIWEFFLPAWDNPVFGGFTAPFLLTHQHMSNFTESVLYVGWLTLLLAVGYVVYCIARRRTIDVERRFVCAACSAMVVVAVLFMPPYPISLGGVDIPTPPYLLWKLIPQFRVPTRFMPLLMTGLVVLAALGLAALRGRLEGRIRPFRWRYAAGAALVVVVAGLSFMELSSVPPTQEVQVGLVPEYRILEKAPPGILAEYPYAQEGEEDNSVYTFWQHYHGRRLLNGGGAGSYAAIVRQSLIDPAAPGVAGALRTLGVSAVIARSGNYQYEGGYFSIPRTLGPGYRLIGRPYHDSGVWAVTAKPAPVPVFFYGFWFGETPKGRLPSRWMSGSRAIVQILSRKAGTYLVHFQAQSLDIGRRLVIHGRHSSWSLSVPGDLEDFGAYRDFFVPMQIPRGRSSFVLTADPGPEIAPAPDQRSVSVYVSNWVFKPLSPARAAKFHPVRAFPISPDPIPHG